MNTLIKYFYPLMFMFAIGIFIPVTEASIDSTKITVQADQSFLDQYNKPVYMPQSIIMYYRHSR